MDQSVNESVLNTPGKIDLGENENVPDTPERNGHVRWFKGTQHSG